MTEWFRDWFGEEYLQLYPHRDQADASAAVELIAGRVPLAGRRVLDLACGSGRHAVLLRERGASVTGLDLSGPLLQRARAGGGASLHLVRGDMRALPFRGAAFQVVVNLFTSFGYFGEDREHASVLEEVARCLVRGGTLVLDYLNAPAVRRGLVPREETVLGTRRVVVQRRITEDSRFVTKDIHVVGEDRHFMERVRLLTPAQLRDLLEQAGFAVGEKLGSYSGEPISEQSTRAIFIATRR